MIRPLLCLALLASSCTPRDPAGVSQTLIVGAPASLRTEFEAIAAAFRARSPGNTANVMFGGATELVATGVPIDVIAADSGEGLDAVAGKLASGERRYYASNPLCLVTRAGAAEARLKTLPITPWVQRLAIADSRGDPTGMAAEAALGRLGVRLALDKHLRYVSRGADVLSAVAKGEADAGLAFAADVAQFADAKALHVAERIADERRARYPIAILAGSPRVPAARRFIDEVLHGEGRTVLAQKGLLAAEAKP